MIYFLSFLCFLFLCLSFVLAFYCFRFARLILNTQDAIEDCIQILDDRSDSISKILQIPLFYDSREIRQVHEDIKKSRDAIVRVAETMSAIEVEVEDDGGEE